MKDKEKERAYHRKYREENKEKVAKRKKEWAEKNREKIAESQRNYRATPKYAKNKEKYREENRDKLAKDRKERRQTDTEFRLSGNLRTRLNIALKKGVGKKCGSTLELTGCTWAELRSHLESQFAEGMTWENYGLYGWHVDHIKPCNSFDLTIDSQQRECFHYTNLQPLWAEDNLKKSDTPDYE